MSTASPSMQNLTRRSIAVEAVCGPVRRVPPRGGAGSGEAAAPLSRLAGAAGSCSLLSRALALAKAEDASLKTVQVREDGSLGGCRRGLVRSRRGGGRRRRGRRRPPARAAASLHRRAADPAPGPRRVAGRGGGRTDRRVEGGPWSRGGRPGDHPEAADRGAGPGRDPGRRAAGVLLQHHRRRPRRREDDARPPDHVRQRHPGAAGPVLHRAGRAGHQDAALPAAVPVLRPGQAEHRRPLHQPQPGRPGEGPGRGPGGDRQGGRGGQPRHRRGGLVPHRGAEGRGRRPARWNSRASSSGWPCT